MRPAVEPVRVRQVRELSFGAVIVRTEKAEDLSRIVDSDAFRKAGLTGERTRKHRPWVLVYDVDVVSQIVGKNLAGVVPEIQAQIRVIAKAGPTTREKSGRVLEDWVGCFLGDRSATWSST